MTDTFMPNWASPPGQTITQLMAKANVSRHELALKMDMTTNQAAALIAGVSKLTKETAEKLATVFGGSPEFWLSRDRQFRKDVQRLPIEDRYQRSWLKAMPCTELVKLGWVEPKRASDEQANQLLSFFDLKISSQWDLRYPIAATGKAFRTSLSFDNRHADVVAWLKWGEKVGSKIRCRPWNPQRFRSRLIEARDLTRNKHPKIFVPELQRICADCGVALVIARTPSGCHASGATQFLTKNKALLLLSFRFRTDDQFWFSFFHEAAHLLLHDLDEIFIDEEIGAGTGNSEENEANAFAAEVLIPNDARSQMLKLRGRYADVIRFAVKQGIAPGIVVGQMQKAGILKYNTLQTLKRRFDQSEINEVLTR